MATKLKHLKVKKVDFVDSGANPDAYIKLFKSKEKGSALEEKEEKSANVFKKIFSFLGKAAGVSQKEMDSVLEEIQKENAISFQETIHQVSNRKIADEIWDVCYALQSALCSILNDKELDSSQTEQAMQESLDEFHSTVKESIGNWASGKESGIVSKKETVSDVDLENMKAAKEKLTKSIEEASAAIEKTKKEEKEGEQEMKIDKSKLTPAELAFLNSIEKRCGSVEEENQAVEVETVVTKVAPEIPSHISETPLLQQEDNNSTAADDIYKGLHPAVKAELEGLKKFREDAEEKELHNIAKRYALIGKKEEELVPVLKELKAAGGTAYPDMIAVLDQVVDMVEKSGAFSEIGKTGSQTGCTGAAEAKVNEIAKGYLEKDSNLSYVEALAKAWELHPELMQEYEQEANF